MDSFSRTCTIVISTIVIASRDESKGEVRGMKVGCESWRINRVPWHVHANRNFKTLITETSSPALFQKELLTIRWFRESWFYPSDLRSQWRSIYSQLKQSQLFPPSLYFPLPPLQNSYLETLKFKFDSAVLEKYGARSLCGENWFFHDMLINPD